jgi:hypothetical protein
MRKILLGISLSFLCGLAVAGPAHEDQDFQKAIKRYAQSSARELMGGLIEQHQSGTSWRLILSQNLPKQIDDRCGYKDKINLPDEGFEQMRNAVSKVAGERFDKAFSGQLSRPSAKLGLVEVKAIKYQSLDQAIVTMRVNPAKTGDILISLLYQLDEGGRMSLCDVGTGNSPESGILAVIGRELER